LVSLAGSSYALPDLATLPETQAFEIRTAYAKAIQTVFIAMAPIIGFCLIICIFIKDHGLQRKEESDVEQVITGHSPIALGEPSRRSLRVSKDHSHTSDSSQATAAKPPLTNGHQAS